MIVPTSRLRFFIRGCCIGLVLLLSACATTVSPPSLPAPDLDWQSSPEIPATIRNSLQGSSILTITAGDGIVVPVRLFGSEGSRTPVLMAHGLQSHSGWFSQSAAFVASLGHPVYVIDRRGSGLSQATRGDSKNFMDWNADIEAVRVYATQRHSGTQVYLLGHCFGAIPATVFAETSPKAIKGLMLTTPGIYTHTSIPFSQMVKIFFSSSGQRDYYFAVPLNPDQFSEIPDYEPFIATDPLALREVTGDLYWQINEARKYISANTDRLTMPILVGFAGEDEIADYRKNKKWLDKVPAKDKTEITYPDARHILEYSLEKSNYFENLRQWLARIEEP